MVTVKICGVRTVAGAQAVARAGADLAGLLLVPGRRRAVDAARAQALLPHLGGAEPVGVFVDTPAPEVLETARALGLRTVQLHGVEPPEQAAWLSGQGLRVVRALRVDGGVDPRAFEAHRAFVHAFLLDGLEPGSGRRACLGDPPRGGWRLLADRPVWLAGGLAPGNVGDALALGIDGLDVASGVERDGEIDPALARAFVAAARGAVEQAEIGPRSGGERR